MTEAYVDFLFSGFLDKKMSSAALQTPYRVKLSHRPLSGIFQL